MESEVDSPSVWDIRCCLLSSIDFAEDFGLSQPKHADAVNRLSQELRTLKKELMSSFEDYSRSTITGKPRYMKHSLEKREQRDTGQRRIVHNARSR